MRKTRVPNSSLSYQYREYHYQPHELTVSRTRETGSQSGKGYNETLPAIVAMNEAIRTADANQVIILVTDGNPSYPAGLHYLNEQRNASVAHKKVIGLQNLDSESEAYRPYKELIERLNRTFKHHIRPSHGFNSVNGAVALVTLFVTHYNFLRHHTSLKWHVPIPLKELEGIATIQGKWAKILSLAA